MKGAGVFSEKQLTEEIEKRFKGSEGGYDLPSIDAFQIGVQIAVSLKEEGKGILNPEMITDGYNWAVEKLFSEQLAT